MKKLFSRLVAMGINGYFLVSTAHAALPPGLPTGEAITLTNIEDLIFDIADFVIVVSGAIIVIMIIWAGIKYMMAGDDTSKATEARGMLKNAIIGACIVLGIGLILATIDYIMTNRTLF